MSHREAPNAELSIFLVTPSSNLTGPPPDLSDINGVSSRKRKRHTKSHSGCAACKRRRVKCDNARPSCRTCIRRGETCSLSSSPLPYKDPALVSPVSSPKGTPCHGFPDGLNTLQMTLFRHFAANTAATLPFGGSVWRNEVISLALKHDYLMHALLLVSAKHLFFLSPDNSECQQASLFHLSRALPRYREEVVNPLSSKNSDPVMAASFLILYFVWSDVDSFDSEDSACFVKDQLFAMTPGVREMFISANAFLSSGQSIFSESTAYHPKLLIDKVAGQCSQKPSHFQQYFCEAYQKPGDSSIMEIREDSKRNIPEFSEIRAREGQIDHNDLWYAVTRPHDPCLIGFLDAVVRLAPLSSIASELQTSCKGAQDHKSGTPGSPEEEAETHVLPGSSLPTADLARYIFSWPIVCSPGVLSLLARKDEGMIFVLNELYKTIKIILPKKYWWAYKRADKMASILKECLLRNLLHPLHSPQIPKEMVARAADFAVQANQTWRQYCLMYAAEDVRIAHNNG